MLDHHSNHAPKHPSPTVCVAACCLTLALCCSLGPVHAVPTRSVDIPTAEPAAEPTSMGDVSAVDGPADAAKNDPTPPSEEDPEVDEIDPLNGSPKPFLAYWLDHIRRLLG